MRPRVAAAQLSHETNRFSSVPTDLAAFAAAGLAYGEDVLPPSRGTNSAFGGFIAGADEQGFDLLPILSVWATPSGMVAGSAFDQLSSDLTAGMEQARAEGGIDGIVLAVHGAMVSERYDDADGQILTLVREAAGPDTPIVATLDLHANISERMVAMADVLIGYDTYPHVDMAERAQEACAVLARLVRREISPRVALRKPPMLPTSQRMTTDRDPMRGLIELAHRFEADPGVVNVTVAGGFPPADVTEAGFSALVTTDGDQRLADSIADQLSAAAWEARDGFLGGVSTFHEAAAELAAQPPEPPGPLIIVDIGDNPWTGGPGDSAELLRFLLEQRIPRAALALIVDPAAVVSAIDVGVGNEVELLLGGKTDRLHGPPLSVTAQVVRLSDGRYRNAGPMMAGLEVNLGPSAVLRCRLPGARSSASAVDVLVTSRAETPIDLNVFRSHGIEPTSLRVIGLKGKGHFRAAFEPIASQVILVEGPGITGADLSRLPFQHIRRPIWPLDPI